MDKQMSLSGLMDELSQARTKKKGFLEQMDQLIPWEKWWKKSGRAIILFLERKSTKKNFSTFVKVF